MRRDSRLKSVKKHQHFSIPKYMSVVRCWDIIGPHIAEEIGGPGYSSIPYCFDTNAYRLGNIFVPISSQVTCCRVVPVVRVIGPIQTYINKNSTNSKWNDTDLHSIRTGSDYRDFQITLTSGKNNITFKGFNYSILSKAEDMVAENNITIDRSKHEDAKWFGLITNVVITNSFELHIVKNLQARTIAIGDTPHTVLFKYDICEMNDAGTVVKSTTKIIRCKWSPIEGMPKDSLPLPVLATAPKSK